MHLFNISFMGHGSLHKEVNIQKKVKPKWFYTGFDGEWKTMGKRDRTTDRSQG